LLGDAGIIRNRLKISSTISNAQAFLDVQNQFGSFDFYIWQFTGGKTLRSKRLVPQDVPAQTEESDAMSKSLKKLGFSLCGFYDLLCLYAGHGHGERSPSYLFSVERDSLNFVAQASACGI